MDNNAFELLKEVQPNSFEKMRLHEPYMSIQNAAAQVQQSLSSKNVSQNREIKLKSRYQIDNVQKYNYTPSLCMSKKEYEAIVNKKPLIKFRPIRNSLIKSFDKQLLAQTLQIPQGYVDKVIMQIINYLTYMNPEGIYYNPAEINSDMYMEERCKKYLLENQILIAEDIKHQEYLFYKEQGDVIEPYVYRHGTKNEVLAYMKYQLSDAKTVLKQLYNILDTECGSLYSYFERPIHVLDNRTIKKMDKIIKTGLSEAEKQGYITNDMYSQNVEWALERIYAIQSDTSLREAFKTVRENS